MSLIKYNEPFFPAFSNLFDSFLGKDFFDNNTKLANWGFATPSVNIKETNDAYHVEVAAPGLAKEDFKVEVDEHRILRISSKKENRQEHTEEGKYTRREFSFQSFQRAFTLPESVDSDKIGASYTDGILNINIPKKEVAKEKPAKVINIG